MSALAQPSFDGTVASGAAMPAAQPGERLAAPSSVITLIAAARAAQAAAPAASPAPANTFVNAPVLVAAAAEPAVTAPEADSIVAKPAAAAPVADQKALLQFVASTKPAEEDAPPAESAAPCVIPQSITFKGEASFPCDAVIEGEFDGTLRVGPNARVTIAAAGMVEGNVYGQSVHVDGSVSGEVHAIGGLASFGPKAFCSGQIHYTRLSIAEGAEIEASMKRVSQAA